MTWLSAVSFGVAISGGALSQDGITAPLSPSLAKAAAARVVTFSQANVVLGQGVFISPQGYALAPGEVAFDSDGNPRRSLRASFGKDSGVPVRIEAFDAVTDLALIRVPQSTEESVLAAVPTSKLNSAVVLVVLPSGSVRGHVARSGVPGVMGLSRRYVPLNEIRLESQQGVTGAPVFLPDGRLAGMLLAALTTEAANDANARSGAGGGFGGGAFVKELAAPTAKTIGPDAPSTAFSIDAAVLQRVIDGFLSENRQVAHPWVGMFFKSSIGGGAIITEVVPGGPAQQAGIGIGDTVTAIGTDSVSNHLDLAAKLFGLRVGSAVEVSILRGGLARKVLVRVATEGQTGSKLQRIASGGKGF